MQIEYTGRQFTITRVTPRHRRSKSVRRIGKILDRITTAFVILAAEKYQPKR